MKFPVLSGSRFGIDLAGLAAAGILTICFGLGAFVPLLQERSVQREAERRIEDGRAQARKLREQRFDLEGDLARIERELTETRVEVEPISRLNARISSLTELASRHKLTLDRVAPGAPQKAPKATLLPIRMEGRGSFPECRACLADLRKAFPDVAVSGLEIARDSAAGPDNAAFVFELVWYAAQASQPAQPAPAK